MSRRRGTKNKKAGQLGDGMGALRDETTVENEIASVEDEIDVVTIDNPYIDPCVQAALAIEGTTTQAINEACTWLIAAPPTTTSEQSASGILATTKTFLSAPPTTTPESSASGVSTTTKTFLYESKESTSSAETQVGKSSNSSTNFWGKEWAAVEELAKHGLANQLLTLLKKKLQADEEAAAERTKRTILNPERQYEPEPIGTPRIPPMPLGVPLYTFLRPDQQEPLPLNYQLNIHDAPMILNPVPTNTIVTTTANANQNITTTNI
ncbi:hypothetical protein QAD02_012780 [Eretmocerus hayati]|uniref:Uncharacterized protein n=1 Tax=Eretmocerus hayati TaxID=131215 RepID=A0ACC2P1L4_9HYME|nr:hypothetical protein QAD02_012780 [Eretmocerus hayati]